MEFVESLVKEGQLVSYGGYLYRKDKPNKTTINWRCAVKACKGRLTTVKHAENGDVPTRVGGEHLHAPDPARIEVKKVHSRVTEKAVNTQEPPRRIIAAEIQPLSQEAISQLRSNRNLAVMINRKRKQVRYVPVAPKSRNRFAIPEEYTRTPGGENFLLYDSGKQDEDHILIIGTEMMVSVSLHCTFLSVVLCSNFSSLYLFFSLIFSLKLLFTSEIGCPS